MKKGVIKKVSILGELYTIINVGDRNRYMIEEGFSAYCNYSKHQIVLSDSADEIVLRHELAHAFLWESGLPHYAMDETLVDWIAGQMPKIVKCYEGVKKGVK